MSLSPTSYTPNPYVPYVWVRIGGVEVTTKNGRPHSLLSLNYKRTAQNFANTFEIALYDPNWSEIEEYILQHRMEVEFRYGYTEGRQSPVFQGYIYDYTPTFAIDGLKLSIMGMSQIMVVEKNRERTRTWKDMDIHEIVQQIALDHGWFADIDECREVLDNDDLESANVSKKRFYQNKMNDLQFIKEILLPRAVRKKDKVANYELNFRDDLNELHFHPPRKDTAEKKTYTFMRDKMSEVASFSPEVSGSIFIAKGAGVSGAAFVDVNTGHYEDAKHSNATTTEKTGLGGELTHAAKEEDEMYHMTELRPLRDKYHADDAARDRYFTAFDNLFNAQLVVMGDPTLNVMDIIRINVIMPDGQPHYMSGLYQILDLEDQIWGGKYTTTMGLIRQSYVATKGVTGDHLEGNARS